MRYHPDPGQWAPQNFLRSPPGKKALGLMGQGLD